MAVNLVVPVGGGEGLSAQGERGHVMFRVADAAGKVWSLIRVEDWMEAHFCSGGAGCYRAPAELQDAQPPGGMAWVRSIPEAR